MSSRETLTLVVGEDRGTERMSETWWSFHDPKTGMRYDWFTTSFRHFKKGSTITFTATTYPYEGRRIIQNPRGFKVVA